MKTTSYVVNVDRTRLVDDVSPTVVITSALSSPTLTNPIPITITFSEDVNGFVVGDLTVGNGTAGDFVTVNGATYTANITPAGMGDVTVDIGAAVCTDVSGNDNTAAVQFTINYIGV